VTEFSARTRAANLERMRKGPVDVLVVGGGIVGAGVARDAACRGFATALVDRGDFASGTSGKTSRLVHGGLRYLRNYRFGLVRRAVRERDLLLRNAPGLVHPLPFLIPAYEDHGPRRTVLRFGLFLYDFLSKEKTLPRRSWLSPEEARGREPRLAARGLQGAGLYHDAWTDDARLVLAIVQDAAEAGAIVANHVEVERLVRTDNRVAGAQLRDTMAGTSFAVSSRLIVNATGVWLDRLRTARPGPTIRPTKGIHVFVSRAKIGNLHALALTAKRDGRVVFVLPWGDLALVGTTDTDFRGDPDRVLPDSGDVAYLLETVNAVLPDAYLGPDDVVSAYAGLRPLLRKGRSETSESDISRDHAILEDPDGLISVTGGKLTTHRAMAEDVGELLAVRLRRPRSSTTRDRPLGPPIRSLGEFMDLGFDEETALHLQGRFAPEQVRRHLNAPAARERIVPSRPHTWAEVEIAVHEEMAVTVADVLVRRLGLFYEAPDQGVQASASVAERIGGLLGWDSQRTERELRAYEDLVRAHQGFRIDHGG
jgi:glycerol-3-phosphate dehydrogenase